MVKLMRSPRNWREDFHLENGNYLCRCVYCSQDFIGYKRRCVCFLCAHPPIIPPFQMIRIILYLGFVALFVASYLIYGMHRDLIIAIVVAIVLISVGELSSVISRAIKTHRKNKPKA
jgi:hypothetical protein